MPSSENPPATNCHKNRHKRQGLKEPWNGNGPGDKHSCHRGRQVSGEGGKLSASTLQLASRSRSKPKWPFRQALAALALVGVVYGRLALVGIPLSTVSAHSDATSPALSTGARAGGGGERGRRGDHRGGR